MDRHYSTLELVKHDETARAPERDYDATAFELDADALAPQAVPDTMPQVFYNTSLPEVHEGSPKEHGSSLHIVKPTLKWPLIVMAVMIAAAIAVGVGVGIWRHRQRSSRTTQQNANITSAPHLILNDTSLAALSLASGERQLFFQDNTGLIRRAVRTASDSQWSTSLSLNTSTNRYLNFSSNPKSHTPLAVTVSRGSDASGSLPTIELYYVSQSHSLSANVLIEGFWSLDSRLEIYGTAVDTRSLSIASIGTEPSGTNTSIETGPPRTNSTSIGNALSHADSYTNLALLYYETSTGNVSALLQRTTSTVQEAEWVDITSQKSQSLPDEFRYGNDSFMSHTLYESIGAYATLSTPFTSGAIPSESIVGSESIFGSPPNIWAVFYSPPNASLLPLYYSVGPSGSGNFSSGSIILENDTSIGRSDIAIFGGSGNFFAFWINGTQPTIVGQQGAGTPDTAFPFARLASVTLADESATFLYHQINGTTFAEEQWDASVNIWTTTDYITVSGS